MKRFKILGLMVLASIFLLINTIGISSATPLSVTNGSFESGLSGWTTTNDGSGGSVSAVTSSAGFVATDGSYFADLVATSTLSQGTSWNAGDVLSFNWNFNANDYMNWNDYSIFQVKDSSSNVIFNLTLSNVAATGDWNATGWNTYSYTFASAGSGSFMFGSYNYGDSANDSELYIDNVHATVPVPEPATMLLLGSGLVGLGGFRKRFFKK